MYCYAMIASPTLRVDHVYKFTSRTMRALWLSRTPSGRAISARDARKHARLDQIEITYVPSKP